MILADKDQIEKRAEVSSVTYESADEAWSQYQKDYFAGYDDAKHHLEMIIHLAIQLTFRFI